MRVVAAIAGPVSEHCAQYQVVGRVVEVKLTCSPASENVTCSSSPNGENPEPRTHRPRAHDELWDTGALGGRGPSLYLIRCVTLAFATL